MKTKICHIYLSFIHAMIDDLINIVFYGVANIFSNVNEKLSSSNYQNYKILHFILLVIWYLVLKFKKFLLEFKFCKNMLYIDCHQIYTVSQKSFILRVDSCIH